MTNPSTQQMYECPRCDTRYPMKWDALACCDSHPKVVTIAVCGECDAEHEFADEAEDCCQEED